MNTIPFAFSIHPGEVLRTEFMEPLGLTAYRLAKDLMISAPRVNDLIRGKRGITGDTALRLSRYFGNSASSDRPPERSRPLDCIARKILEQGEAAQAGSLTLCQSRWDAPRIAPGWNGTEPEQREGEGAVEPWERRQRAILSSVGAARITFAPFLRHAVKSHGLWKTSRHPIEHWRKESRPELQS